jgi:hypothetical protein
LFAIGSNLTFMPRISPPQESTALNISPGAKKELTKSQIQFNQLIARIELLQKEIPQEQAKFDALLKSANDRILPVYEKMARAKIDLCFALDKWSLKLEFKKKQLENAGECILFLLDQAATMIEFSDEDRALYERWAGASIEEVEAERASDEKGMMQDLFEAFYGVKIDLDELQNDPEKMEEFKQQFEAKKESESQWHKGKRGRKPPKASKKEELKKAQEELKSKSVRSIYISLAKLVHPDMEADPSLRAAKEEEMKKVTAAYEANDLATLLKMEMEWIHKQNNQLDKIPEEKLGLFVQVLKDQVKELEAEKNGMMWDPRYAIVREYAYGRQETGMRKIKKEADELQGMLMSLEETTRSFEVPNPKKRITAFIQNLMDQMNPFGFF